MLEEDKAIKEFVKNARKQGKDIEAIREDFKKQGYPDYIAEYYMRKKKHIPALLIIVVLCIAIGAGALYIFKPQIIPKLLLEKCADKACFLQKADACEPAFFAQNEQGTFMELTSRNCKLTKKIVQVSPQEKEDIRKAVTGKSMICRYEKNYFNKNWVNTMTLDIQQCEGQLKDTIMSILNA
ncbi:MAG: hypothetical protein AABX86_02840 [Nanoarchaeota archaeon]